MIEIQLSSDAFNELRRIMQSPETYMVRIEERRDGLAIKRNEGTWSPTLATMRNPAQPPQQPRSTIEQIGQPRT